MNKTEINWTELTWNAASGCTKVSAECKHCYAHTIAENKRGTAAFPDGFDITIRPHKLRELKAHKKPALIFTNSMTDMFHADIPDSYRDQMFEAIRNSPHHRYQVLTKRPEIAARYFQTRKVPDSVWLGVTVGVRATLDRVDILRQIDAKVRFLSCEPLLEQLDGLSLDGIHWLIGGGESGSHLSDPKVSEKRSMVERNFNRATWPYPWKPRTDRIQWARHLRDLCAAGGVAFWWKQWGGPTPKGGGRSLDGAEWDEMPTVHGAMPEGYAHRQIPLKTIAV
jgi:protein gp37